MPAEGTAAPVLELHHSYLEQCKNEQDEAIRPLTYPVQAFDAAVKFEGGSFSAAPVRIARAWVTP